MLELFKALLKLRGSIEAEDVADLVEGAIEGVGKGLDPGSAAIYGLLMVQSEAHGTGAVQAALAAWADDRTPAKSKAVFRALCLEIARGF